MNIISLVIHSRRINIIQITAAAQIENVAKYCRFLQNFFGHVHLTKHSIFCYTVNILMRNSVRVFV